MVYIMNRMAEIHRHTRRGRCVKAAALLAFFITVIMTQTGYAGTSVGVEIFEMSSAAAKRMPAGTGEDQRRCLGNEQKPEDQQESGNHQKTVNKRKPESKQKNGEKWQTKNGYCYCYSWNQKKKKYRKVTGPAVINGKKYLFDNSGRQMTGWRKVGDQICYFQIENGKKGYMLTRKTINGIPLQKNGNAKVTDDNRQKVTLLLRYQELADTLVKPADPKDKKLVCVFKYARDVRFKETGNARHTPHWDWEHAQVFLDAGYADCVVAAVGFGYLANAIGYKNITVHLYGHGHCEIDRKIYDPSYAKNVPDAEYTKYFGRTYEELPAWWSGTKSDLREI